MGWPVFQHVVWVHVLGLSEVQSFGARDLEDPKGENRAVIPKAAGVEMWMRGWAKALSHASKLCMHVTHTAQSLSGASHPIPHHTPPNPTPLHHTAPHPSLHHTPPSPIPLQLIVFVSCLLAGATRLLSSQIVRSLMSVEIDSVAFTLVSQTARMHVESLIVLICLIFSGATHSICLRQFLRVQFVDSLMTVRRSSVR